MEKYEGRRIWNPLPENIPWHSILKERGDLKKRDSHEVANVPPFFRGNTSKPAQRAKKKTFLVLRFPKYVLGRRKSAARGTERGRKIEGGQKNPTNGKSWTRRRILGILETFLYSCHRIVGVTEGWGGVVIRDEEWRNKKESLLKGRGKARSVCARIDAGNIKRGVHRWR